MEVKAVGKYIKVQPRKVRIVADNVRGSNALRMATVLKFHKSKAAQALRKVLISAMSNAEANHGLSSESLKVAAILIDEGPRMKRIQARAMGRAYRIVKKTSHITVVVEEAEFVAKVKPTGTKPKPRPTFGESKKQKPRAKLKPEVVAAPSAEETIEGAPEVVGAEPNVVEADPVEAAEVASNETEADAPQEVAEANLGAEEIEATAEVAEARAEATEQDAASEADEPASNEETPDQSEAGKAEKPE